jgi:hypothetical protein
LTRHYCSTIAAATIPPITAMWLKDPTRGG